MRISMSYMHAMYISIICIVLYMICVCFCLFHTHTQVYKSPVFILALCTWFEPIYRLYFSCISFMKPSFNQYKYKLYHHQLYSHFRNAFSTVIFSLSVWYIPLFAFPIAVHYVYPSSVSMQRNKQHLSWIRHVPVVLSSSRNKWFWHPSCIWLHNYLPYCVPGQPPLPTPVLLKLNWPWRYDSSPSKLDLFMFLKLVAPTPTCGSIYPLLLAEEETTSGKPRGQSRWGCPRNFRN